LETLAYHSEIDKQKVFRFAEAVRLATRFVRHDLSPIEVQVQLPEDDLVLGSEGHIVQVLVNLLRNSGNVLKDHPPAAGPELSIRAERHEAELRILVRDNGQGMDAQSLSRIFEPFLSTKVVGQGMGLGLSICHTIVRNHGYELTVDSRPGEWSEFRFGLSLAGAQPA